MYVWGTMAELTRGCAFCGPGRQAPGGHGAARAAKRDEEEAECGPGSDADLESDRAQARDRGQREEQGGTHQALPFNHGRARI